MHYNNNTHLPAHRSLTTIKLRWAFFVLKEADAKTNPSYIVWRIVLFSDGCGLVLSKNLKSHNFYVTMQFTQERRCYRGSYHGNPLEARQDFRQRVLDYQQTQNVRITKIYGLDIRHPNHH